MTNPIYSPPVDQVTTAVLGLLNTTGRTVYDGAYGGDPTSPAYPFGILYSLAGGSTDALPDLDDERQHITLAYQVSTVSNLRNQCEATARLFHDRLTARRDGSHVYALPMPTGWVCINRRADPAQPGTDPDGTPPARVFTRPARYLLTITPA